MEQPADLLGSAALVERTDVADFVKAFRAKHEGEHEVTKFVEQRYTVEEAKCFVDETGRVRLLGLVEKERSSV